jgi:hypothetical protein
MTGTLLTGRSSGQRPRHADYGVRNAEEMIELLDDVLG